MILGIPERDLDRMFAATKEWWPSERSRIIVSAVPDKRAVIIRLIDTDEDTETALLVPVEHVDGLVERIVAAKLRINP